MTKRLLRKTLIAGVTIIALVLFVRILYWAGVYIEMRTNHTKYQELIDANLTYERETMDEQLNMTLDWFEHRHLFNGDKGRICERISLIYQVKGDEMAYYRYLGYALYYLEQSDDKDYTVNIYLDLANFYINNYSYDSAQRMIESAQKIEPFEEIESLQVNRPVMAVEAILVPVKGVHVDRNVRIVPCILDHDIPVLLLVEQIHPFEEPVPGVFTRDGIGESEQDVVEVLRHLGDSKVVRIRPPYPAVIDIPAATSIVHQYDTAVVIHEHPGITDLEGFIAGVGVRSQGFNGRVQAAKVGRKGIPLLLPAVTLFLDFIGIQ